VKVGLGPAGELRYPSYQLKLWNFPGIGEYPSTKSLQELVFFFLQVSEFSFNNSKDFSVMISICWLILRRLLLPLDILNGVTEVPPMPVRSYQRLIPNTHTHTHTHTHTLSLSLLFLMSTSHLFSDSQDITLINQKTPVFLLQTPQIIGRVVMDNFSLVNSTHSLSLSLKRDQTLSFFLFHFTEAVNGYLHNRVVL
jgi:hypothetical protein